MHANGAERILFALKIYLMPSHVCVCESERTERVVASCNQIKNIYCLNVSVWIDSVKQCSSERMKKLNGIYNCYWIIIIKHICIAISWNWIRCAVHDQTLNTHTVALSFLSLRFQSTCGVHFIYVLHRTYQNWQYKCRTAGYPMWSYYDEKSLKPFRSHRWKP